MKRLSPILAALSLFPLTACNELFGSDEVTATVTDTANVRDAATTDGSNVIAKLEAGTELSGEWVETGSGPRDKWLEFDFNGKKAFVWEGNLKSSSKDNSIVSPDDNTRPRAAESDKSQGAPTQSPELASGIYFTPEICGAASAREKCANESVLKRLCESIEDLEYSSLISPAYAHSMAGKINVPREAIIHLITNGQFFAFKNFYDNKKSICMISFKLEGQYQGTYYNTPIMYAKVLKFEIVSKDGRQTTIMRDAMNQIFYE